MNPLSSVFKSPIKLAVLYVAASVFIGPAALVLGWTWFTSGKGDYCDSVYDVPGGRVLAAHQFHNAQIFQVTASVIMIVLGVVLACRLGMYVLKNKRRNVRYIILLLAMVAMIFGYVTVISSAGKGGQIC